jgi:hypothetical protein
VWYNGLNVLEGQELLQATTTRGQAMDDMNEYIDATRDLLMSKGWAYIVEELEELVDMRSDVRGIASIEDLYLHKGMVMVAQGLLDLQRDIESIEQERMEEEGVH